MKIYISSTLRSFFERRTEIEVSGDTIRKILSNLIDEYPDAKKGLYDENGNLREFIRIFVGDEDRTEPAYLDAVIPEDAEVLLLPSIAGGAPEESIISDERRKAETLDDAEIDRFNKHLLLREISVKGQKRIKAANPTLYKVIFRRGYSAFATNLPYFLARPAYSLGYRITVKALKVG